MTEFEKARDEAANRILHDSSAMHGNENEWDGFELGANWAYEYCKKHRPYAEVCDFFAKAIIGENEKLRAKLAITREALEDVMVSNNPKDQYLAIMQILEILKPMTSLARHHVLLAVKDQVDNAQATVEDEND